MAIRYTDEFRRDAVRIAQSSGLARPKVASDLGVGFSTTSFREAITYPPLLFLWLSFERNSGLRVTSFRWGYGVL